MKRKIGTACFAVVVMAACGQAQTQEAEPAQAQPAPAPVAACSDAEYRQLDFWVGEWDLEWDVGDGTTGHGTNIITNSPYGDCVITENFDGGPSQNYKGMSVSTYHKPMGMWRQTWVDDQGGYFALSGGPNDEGVFQLDMTRLKEEAPYRRMVWKDVKPDSLIWHWQGHGTDETEWKDLWVIRYTRKSSS